MVKGMIKNKDPQWQCNDDCCYLLPKWFSGGMLIIFILNEKNIDIEGKVFWGWLLICWNDVSVLNDKVIINHQKIMFVH